MKPRDWLNRQYERVARGLRPELDDRQMLRLVSAMLREFPDDGTVSERFREALERAQEGVADQDRAYGVNCG